MSYVFGIALARRIATILLLVVLVLSTAYVWLDRTRDSAEADSHDSFSGVFDDELRDLEDQYGEICAEFVTSEPDGVILPTGISQGQQLPAEINALTSRPNAPAGWFNGSRVTAESVTVIATGSQRAGERSPTTIVAEAVELWKYADVGGGNTRWEVVEPGILYPCHDDGSPKAVQ